MNVRALRDGIDEIDKQIVTLLKLGIIVRPLTGYGMADWLRVMSVQRMITNGSWPHSVRVSTFVAPVV